MIARTGWRAADLFAGAGGFTEAASIAGHRVVWAANHSPASGRVLPFVRGPQAWPELRPQPELFIRRVGGGA